MRCVLVIHYEQSSHIYNFEGTYMKTNGGQLRDQINIK